MRSLRASAPAADVQLVTAVSLLKAGPPMSHDSSNCGTQLPKSEEPEKRKRSMSGTFSPPLKKQATASSACDEKKVDPAVLQFQNQKLCQQIDSHKERIQDLESKLKTLESKQVSYDTNLIAVNRIWTQLMDDLGILAVKASAPLNGSSGSVPALEDREDWEGTDGDLFLKRLLRSCPDVEPKECESDEKLLEKALEARSSQTVKVLKCIVAGIEQQRRFNENLVNCAKEGVSEKEVLELLEANTTAMQEELSRTRKAIDQLQDKHHSLTHEVTMLRAVKVRQQTEIQALKEQLEDRQTELESSKRKLSSLKQQLEEGGGASVHGTPRSSSRLDLHNGDSGKACGEDMSRLRQSLEEAQRLASRRLDEIEAKHEEHMDLLKKIHDLEVALKDEQRIKASQAYVNLSIQLATSKSDLEHLRTSFEGLQREKNVLLVREKEMVFRAEAGDAAKRALGACEQRLRDLEAKLRQCAEQRDELQLQVEQLNAQAGRGGLVKEMKLMLEGAQKGMGVLQEQLKKYKALVDEVPSVKAENKTLHDVLLRKSAECDEMRKKTEAMVELLKQQEKMQECRGTELELRLLVDMFERESLDGRDIRELKQAEVRALAEVERLKQELDEHGLALRVKAANEAEAACQQRLAAAETEITQLREQLVASNKKVLELQELLKTKGEESDVYVNEIETIGQAYEEMQAQNRRLMEQMSEQEEYNSQLLAESVKARQLKAWLTAEQKDMEERMKHAAGLASVDRERAQHLEEQLKLARAQYERVLEELRKAQGEAEAARRQQAEAERESSTLKRAALESENDLAAREKRIMEMEESLEKERHRVKRVEEEKAAVEQRLQRAEQTERGNSSTAQEMSLLHEELREYKSLLKCSVCHDRRKEVAITKCFHLFCSPCIQKNLEVRHRKCPGCGVPFGSGDVKQVYM